MKKILSLYQLIITFTLSFNTSLQTMQQADRLLESMTTRIDKLKEAQPKEGEINSPAIQKEQTQEVQSLIKNAEQLDAITATLPTQQRAELNNKQSALLEQAKPVLKTVISNGVTATWRQYGKAIAQAAMDGVLAGITTAAIGTVSQGIKMGTGNLLALDTNTLLLTCLTATAGAALSALTTSRSSLLLYATPTAFNESLIVPSITHYAYTFKMPSLSGPIKSWITNEAMIIVNEMIEKNGGLSKMLGSINLTQTLLPTANKQIGTPSNELVAAALPTVQSIITNQKIATALTEVGWIVTQSAVVGATLYLSGFGYADSTMTQSVGYAVLTGIAQGTVATVAALVGVSPGAIVKITSVPLAQQALTIAGGTRQGAVTAVIQATVTEVSNVLLNESKKAGGLLQTLQKGKELLGQTIRSRWSSAWTTIADAWKTIQSVEPIPL
jgi:hypothetical protein